MKKPTVWTEDQRCGRCGHVVLLSKNDRIFDEKECPHCGLVHTLKVTLLMPVLWEDGDD